MITGGISSAILGLILIFIQLFMPDFIPGILGRLLPESVSSFRGFEFILVATMRVLLLGGFILLITGSLLAILGLNRRNL